MSCDLIPSETVGLHYQIDVLELLGGWEPVQFSADCGDDDLCQTSALPIAECSCIGPTQDGIEYKEHRGYLLGRPIDRPHWDMMIAFPPCTYLCSSGIHWNGRVEGRQEKTEGALEFVRALLYAPIPRIALENPVGCISTRIRKPDQIIQPWQFGHPESKSTCLWLKGLSPLKPTNILDKPASGRWENQTPSGQNKLGPSIGRAKERSRTYAGIAQAIADQWGKY